MGRIKDYPEGALSDKVTLIGLEENGDMKRYTPPGYEGSIKYYDAVYFEDEAGARARWRFSGGYMYLDKTLTATGFSGVEDTDWEEILSF